MTTRMCWAPTGKDNICGGEVQWTKQDHWSSHCRKCGASGRAAAGERLDLEGKKARA